MHNHERDELQKRLKINADGQQARAAAQAKKPRHKIPAEGLQFANHAELQAHFSQRYLENLANTNETIRRFVLNLVFITRYMRSKGPWQRHSRCPSRGNDDIFVVYPPVPDQLARS